MQRLAALAIATLPLAACVVDDTVDLGQSSHEIVGGQINNGDPAVVAIWAETGGRGALCTGSLIAPDVVLTAAHCLDRIGTPDVHFVYFGSDFNAFLDGNDPTAIGAIDVASFIYDQQFTDEPNEALFDGHDIGLIRLAEPAPVTPIAYNRTPLEALIGNDVRLAGFGTDNAAANTAGIKREAIARLDDLSTELVFYGVPAEGTQYTNTCSGDSGGPTLMNINGSEVVVGITSFGDENCQQLGASTRVDRFATSFIEPFIGNGPTCSADGVCDSDCQMPDPDCTDGGDAGDNGSSGGNSNSDGNTSQVSSSGCSTGGSSSSLGWLLLIGAAVVLRRRPRH